MPNFPVAPNSSFYAPPLPGSVVPALPLAYPAPTYLRQHDKVALQPQHYPLAPNASQPQYYPASTLAGLPVPSGYSYATYEPSPSYQEMQDLQPQALHEHVAPAPPAATTSLHYNRNPDKLGAYNDALEQVRADLNDTMTPAQRSLGRTLTIIGSLAAVGGGVAAGLLGLGALGAAASAVGLPVAAVAGIAAAAVFVGGTAIAVTTGAIARLLVRKSLQHDPALQDKLGAVRTLRDQLLQRPSLNKGERKLLENANRILGKVDGLKSQYKSQLKLAAKTEGIAIFSAVILAISSLALVARGGFGGGSGGFMGSGSQLGTKGSALGGDSRESVFVEDGERLLHLMQAPLTA